MLFILKQYGLVWSYYGWTDVQCHAWKMSLERVHAKHAEFVNQCLRVSIEPIS